MILRGLVYSNLFIALAAAGATLTSDTLLGVRPEIDSTVALVFFSTLAVYTLDRLYDAPRNSETDSQRLAWLERHRRELAWLSASAMVGASVCLFWQPSVVWWVLIPLGLISAGYSLPLLPAPRGWLRLKDVSGLKLPLVAAVWTGATVLVPIFEARGASFGAETAILAGERALFIFALCVPFDVRDIERDRDAGLVTLPHVLGESGALAFGAGLMALFAGWSAWRYGLGTGVAGPPLAVSGLVAAWLVGRADRRRHSMYFVGLLDGMLVLQWISVAGWMALTSG